MDIILYYFFWFFIHLDLIAMGVMIVGAVLLWRQHYKAGKKWLFTGLVPFLIINLSPLGPFGIMYFENALPRPTVLPEKVDGLILLGGCYALRETRERGEPVYNMAGTRNFQFMDLAKKYPDAKIMFTGNTIEAEWTEKALLDHGFSRDRLIFDSDSRSTLDHPVHLKKLVDPHKNYILVTSAFHMAKSLSHFQREGFTNLIPYSVDYHTPGHFSLELWYAYIIQRITPMSYKQTCVELAGLVRGYVAGSKSLFPKV